MAPFEAQFDESGAGCGIALKHVTHLLRGVYEHRSAAESAADRTINSLTVSCRHAASQLATQLATQLLTQLATQLASHVPYTGLVRNKHGSDSAPVRATTGIPFHPC